MDLAESAARFAAEAERERRLPAELVAEMADAGVFRLCVPRAAGGLEEHPTVLVETVEALARGDGAAGWCAAIGATSGLLSGYIPEEAAREVYASPRAIAGGVFAPFGRATRVEGGFRVTGRWSFASGCTHCDWLMGGCFVEGEDPPVPRLMLAHADEVEIHDTWDAMGLRGTGSHDIEMRDVFVPSERTASLVADRPTASGRLYAFPVFGLLALAIGAVGLGIARGALDDVIELAGRRTPTGSRRTMGERPAVQADVAGAETKLRAARAFLLTAVDDAWNAAGGDGGEVPVEQRVALRLAATHAATAGAEVTGVAYRLGGGSSVYESRSALPRRFRDANTATQHMLVAPATNELTGRLLLGVPTDTSQL
ncbi:MAG TPA: acyl-CoA dehydrogenase family protein [Thermoleophilaceae bacterium]|jgi:alkylation response protein AidB-like acyl-CoA dehydrogenase